MVESIQVAREAAKKAIENTYDGIAVVTEHRKVTDKRSKLTNYEDIIVLEDIPCKLSFKTIHTASQGESSVSVSQTTKLFLSPDIVIKAGSKITVTQSGVTMDYTYSGVPAVYDTHQEIELQLFERWT